MPQSSGGNASGITTVEEVESILAEWERSEGFAGWDWGPLVGRLSELAEAEHERYLKQDPDPFDDRHPGRADPGSGLGLLLKTITKHDAFMNKLINSYLLHRASEQEGLVGSPGKALAARLLLNVMPGLEASAVFAESEEMVSQLLRWAESAAEPLRSYAVGLLGAAMEVQEVAGNYRDRNFRLVPILLQRLQALQDEDEAGPSERGPSPPGPFAHLQAEHFDEGAAGRPSLSQVLRQRNDGPDRPDDQGASNESEPDQPLMSTPKALRQNSAPLRSSSGIRSTKRRALEEIAGVSGAKKSRKNDEAPLAPLVAPLQRSKAGPGVSSSSWAELQPYVIGRHSLHPLTPVMQQRLILAYLIPCGEYQDLLSHAYEDQRALKLIRHYIDLTKNKDVRLAFDALRYLASLLVHRKLALEWVAHSGVSALIAVFRDSMASSGVSLCLYYLAYNSEVMEKVCLLEEGVLEELVDYALHLLQHSHESGRCHATMFFIYAFPFRAILELFDAKDGLRKLFNYISTLAILQEEDAELSDDQLYQSRMAIRNVVTATRNYLTAHLWHKADAVRRSQQRQLSAGASLGMYMEPIPSFVSALPPWKAVQLEEQGLKETIWALMTCLPMSAAWKPVEDLRRLAGVPLLLRIVTEVVEWDGFAARNELIATALHCLWVASVLPKVQLELSGPVRLRDESETNGLAVLLSCCEGEMGMEPNVQIAALNLLINCLCGPGKSGTLSLPTTLTKGQPATPKGKLETMNGDGLLARLWDQARANNGMMILRNLLMIKTPLSEADEIRALAVKALDGLARCAHIRQILSKMPLIAANELHWLMREPVLQDKRAQHERFVRHAKSLIERVSGKRLDKHVPCDMTQETLWRNYVVYQTRINFNEKELLQLIQQYLKSKGFARTAASLGTEAALPSIPASLVPPEPLPKLPFPRRLSAAPLQMPSQPRAFRSNMVGGITAYLTGGADFRNLSSSRSAQSLPSTPLPRGRLPFSRDTPKPQSSKDLDKGLGLDKVIKAENSLEAIVTQYLRQQHATCPHPVSSCPPFSLLYKHNCPEPKLKQSAPSNLTRRFLKRAVFPVGGGYDGIRCDRRFAFSRFKAVRSYKDPAAEETFTTAAFSADDSRLLLGNYTGEVKVYNVASGAEEATHTCHSSALNSVQQSRDGRLLLTSSDYVKPMSAVWVCGEGYLERKLALDEETYLELGSSSTGVHDRLLGTNQFSASLFDLHSGQSVQTFYDEASANRYSRNRAHFHPLGEELVLNDGCLWDPRSAALVHKFDKLNPHNSGLFHPRGLQVLINSEVWDVRSFRLLHTVPALDQCKVTFSGTGDVIYGILQGGQEDEFFEDVAAKTHFGSSFRTFDAADFTQIATQDVKRIVLDMAADSHDAHVALIETLGAVEDQPTPSDENLARLYEVGKVKAEDEDADDDPDALNQDDDDDDDDDDEEDDDDDILDIVDDDQSGSSSSSSSSDDEDSEAGADGDAAPADRGQGDAAGDDEDDEQWVTDDSDDHSQSDNSRQETPSFLDATYRPGMSDDDQ